MGPYPVTDFLANEASLLIGFFFFIPLMFINNSNNTFIRISLLGIASAFVAIPTLPDAQLCASKVADDSKEVKVSFIFASVFQNHFIFLIFFKSLVSGIWQAAIASASVIAGPLGGILYGLVPLLFFLNCF